MRDSAVAKRDMDDPQKGPWTPAVPKRDLCVPKRDLDDLDTLLIEGTEVEMKFYYDILEMLCGKEDLQDLQEGGSCPAEGAPKAPACPKTLPASWA